MLDFFLYINFVDQDSRRLTVEFSNFPRVSKNLTKRVQRRLGRKRQALLGPIMRENVRNLNVSGINGNLALRAVLFEDFFSLILISSRCSCSGWIEVWFRTIRSCCVFLHMSQPESANSGQNSGLPWPSPLMLDMSWERETEEKPDPEIEPEWFQQAQWHSEMNRPVSMLVNGA